ncbi:MAG TPA: glutaredoxin family protein [Dongiaceae bacterium]|nr:glutaredoxin family protein [Dongiaceae bacterium]
MKKWVLILLALFVVQKWDAIQLYFNPPAPRPPGAPSEVILYATSWCGYCAKTRELLQENKIDYQEFDIEKSSEGRAKYEALNGSGVPLLVINGTVVRGYNESRILELTR